MANYYYKVIYDATTKMHQQMERLVKRHFSGLGELSVKVGYNQLDWECDIPLNAEFGERLKVIGSLETSVDPGVKSRLRLWVLEVKDRRTFPEVYRSEGFTTQIETAFFDDSMVEQLIAEETKKAFSYIKKHYADKLADNVRLASRRY